MGSKRIKFRAHREWRRVHVEAWQRSGLSQRDYCRQHGLTETTFGRWLKELVGDKALRAKAEIEREERLERRRRKQTRLSADSRSKAVQAFWAMHVEALNWSGLSISHYARALGISANKLGRWRNLIDTEAVSIDWRALLHPSARPLISSDVSSAAKRSAAETTLTKTATPNPSPNRRVTRRSFTDEEKLAIVMESEEPDVSAVAVCRRHDIATSMLFRWRAQFGFHDTTTLATVAMAGTKESGAGASPLILHNLLPVPDGMAAVDLPDGRQVFASADCDPDAVRRHVADWSAAS